MYRPELAECRKQLEQLVQDMLIQTGEGPIPLVDSEYNLLFLDLETSGLNPREHGITEAGWWSLDLHEIEGCKVHFNRHAATPTALELNGYDEEIWSLEAIDPGELAWKLSDVLHHSIIVGSNPHFDLSFLEELYHIYAMTVEKPKWYYKPICIGSMSFGITGDLMGQPQIMRSLDLEPCGQKHRAQDDVLNLIRAFVGLLQARIPSAQF